MNKLARTIRKASAIILAMVLSLPGMTGALSSAQAAEDQQIDAFYESFRQPAQEKKPSPLWFWNREVEDMTTDMVREIVRESFLQSGHNGFGILPQWQADYLTEEYFELYEAALDEGSKYGMKFSLYDENGFPSYNAGGLFGERYPELITNRLDMISQDAADGESVLLELPQGKLMGAVAMNTETFERIDISAQAVIREPAPFDPAKEPVGVSASTTYAVTTGYEADKAVDGDFSTRWNSASGSGGNQYLQVKFESAVPVNKVKAYEPQESSLHRTKRHSVQYYNYETAAWETVAEGKTITDTGVIHSFDTISSDLIRLYIGSVSGDSATISEFQIFLDDAQYAVPKTPEVVEERLPGYYASSKYNDAYDAKYAFDGDMTTRWNANGREYPPHWVDIVFGSGRTVDSVIIKEHLNRITGYEIQYLEGQTWKTVQTGTTIGEGNIQPITFSPVITTEMRFLITGTNDFNPTIWEIEYYNGEEKLKIDGADDVIPEGSYLQHTVADGKWKVMAFMSVKDNRNGMDYLNPESVDAFIEMTHGEYYRRFKKYFDNGTITSSFFDEPTFWPAVGGTGATSGRLWTPIFNETYSEYYNSNPVLDYPAMFMDIGAETASARSRMNYVRAEMFTNNYIARLDKWCADHGIELTGHMLVEEWTNPSGNCGDLLKVFKNQAIPGVDIINHVGFSQEAYKVVSSSAYNWDKAKVMSESFGVFGSTDGVDFYRSAMDQFAKGINLVIPHAVWYDDDPARVTYKPEFSYRHPTLAPLLPALNEYLARGHIVLQEGRHVADIAMLYPIDYLQSEFLFNGHANNGVEGADYMLIGETLSLKERRDFTYLHPDIINEKIQINGDTMYLPNDVNYEEYKVFVMPGTKVISLTNLKKIKEFYDAGGKVIATTLLPFKGIHIDEDERVIEIIKEMFGVDPTDIANIPNEYNIYRSSSDYSASYNAAKAFDGVISDLSRWNSASRTGGDQWLEVEFPQPATFNRTVIDEFFPRTTAYRLQYFDDAAQDWVTIHTGTSIGRNKIDTFADVTAKRLRLYIDTVSPDVTISEFEVYYNDSENLALDKSGGKIAPNRQNENGGVTYFLRDNAANLIGQALDEVVPVYDVEIEGVDSVSDGNFSYIHKVKEDRNIYFFGNSSKTNIDATIYLRGEINKPMLWNPYDGSRTDADYEVITGTDGGLVTKVKLDLPAIQSVYIVESIKEDEPKPVHKEELADLVAKANRLNEEAYTIESWKPFAEALTEALAILDDNDANQQAVNAACEQLDAAMQSLVKEGSGEDIPVTKIKINASGLFTLSIKKKAQIPVMLEPDDATDRTVQWISTNPNIFTIDAGGIITPKKQGTATLTAQSSNGLKSTIIVRITA